MSAHALPPGPEARARARAASQRRFRQTAPLLVVQLSALLVVSPAMPSGQHDLVSTTAAFVAWAIAAGCVGAIGLIAFTVADDQALKLAARQSQPRPRTHYALIAVGYLALAGIGVLAGLQYRQGWIVGLAGVAALWACAAALIMLGRAVCWGRARRALWWHRPNWLTRPPSS